MTKEPSVWHHHGESQKPLFHYKGCGLDDVYLASGYEVEQTPYGDGVRIKNLDSLHTQIGLYLAKSKKSLGGREIRFLRHQMDLTQSELARLFGCSGQQVARYEKNQSKLNGPADRMLRILFEEYTEQTGSVRELLGVLDSMDDNEASKVVFAESNGEWKQAA
jgi:putative transcriptional regulator